MIWIPTSEDMALVFLASARTVPSQELPASQTVEMLSAAEFARACMFWRV